MENTEYPGHAFDILKEGMTVFKLTTIKWTKIYYLAARWSPSPPKASKGNGATQTGIEGGGQQHAVESLPARKLRKGQGHRSSLVRTL